jgi:DNA segregation ATPase FtsK/SpoIIIE, S-DNA-T family
LKYLQLSINHLEGDQYDPKLDLGGYQMPTIDLLQDYEVAKTEIDRTELEHSKNLIIETLKNYNIGISEIKANIGPTVTSVRNHSSTRW